MPDIYVGNAMLPRWFTDPHLDNISCLGADVKGCGTGDYPEVGGSSCKFCGLDCVASFGGVVTTSTRRFRGAPRLVLNIEDTTSMALDNDHFRTRLSFAQWPSRPARRAVDQGDERGRTPPGRGSVGGDNPRDGPRRTRDDLRHRATWRTGPTEVRSGMLTTGARTLQMISRTSAIP